jgi:hypothetical protein
MFFYYVAIYHTFVILLIKKFIVMKKFVLLSMLSITFSVIVSSCKSHEKCPAYTKANTTNSAKKSI